MTYPECFYHDWSIQCIIEAFEETPTEFERFCGDLFKQMGYQVHVTSPTKKCNHTCRPNMVCYNQ